MTWIMNDAHFSSRDRVMSARAFDAAMDVARLLE
jgi:hypothetical protein